VIVLQILEHVREIHRAIEMASTCRRAIEGRNGASPCLEAMPSEMIRMIAEQLNIAEQESLRLSSSYLWHDRPIYFLNHHNTHQERADFAPLLRQVRFVKAADK